MMTTAVRLVLCVGMLLLAAATRPVPVSAAVGRTTTAAPEAIRTPAPPVVTAREIFEQLPSSIFDNTAEGLPDEEKERLLDTGQCEFWEVVGETDDVIAFRSLPFRDSAVALRLFRNTENGEILAAIGTLGVPICALELWKRDTSGRIVPADTPEDPDISEFFDADVPQPRDVSASVLPCLGLGGLKAQVVFWGATGMMHLPVARDIGWHWTGRSFEKIVRPHALPEGTKQAE